MGFPGDVGGYVGGIGGVAIGYMNYKEQKKMNRWQKRVYQESLVREDTAVQRRAADLRAAGLSPVLAAGQGASTMAPISLNAPKMDVNPSELAAAAMTMMSQEAEISKTKEQEKLNAAQKELNAAQKKLVDEQRLEVNAKRRETEWNLSRYVKHKLPTNYRGSVNDVAFGVDAAEQAAERLRLKMLEQKRIEQEAARQKDRERNPHKYKKITTGVKG